MFSFFQREIPIVFQKDKVKNNSSIKQRKKITEGITVAEVSNHNTKEDCWMIIENKVYNITSWIDKHPGGDIILSYAGLDATDVFEAFHDESTEKWLKPFYIGDVIDLQISDSLREYRELRKKLKQNKVFESNKIFYFYKLMTNLSLLALSVYFVWNFKNFWFHLLGAISLAFFWQQCGWLAHDFCHHQVFKKRKYNDMFSFFLGNICQGFSVSWWKTKHNMHHAVPNIVGYDPDIDTLPFLAWSEKLFEGNLEGLPQFLIKHQIFFYVPLLTVARINWLVQSALHAYFRPKKGTRMIELITLFIHYVWLFTLVFASPTMSFLQGINFILIAETLTGVLLSTAFTLNHNGMNILDKGSQGKIDFHKLQTITARDVTEGPFHFVSWFMGGLDKQIEHHLFPTLPRHNLNVVSQNFVPICEKHNIYYHKTNFWQGTVELLKGLYQVSSCV
jgi:fatty acid desaturase